MASQRQIQSPDQKTEQVSIPPHSTEAEQAVLGGIMLSNQHWDGVAERVIAEDFYTFAHKAIFQTMEELMRNQSPIDLITLDPVSYTHLDVYKRQYMPRAISLRWRW